jgi:hypothetical protein
MGRFENRGDAKAIEQAFQGFLRGLYQGAKLEGGIENIRFLTSTMALIDITGEATPPQGPPRRLRGVPVSVHDRDTIRHDYRHFRRLVLCPAELRARLSTHWYICSMIVIYSSNVV